MNTKDSGDSDSSHLRVTLTEICPLASTMEELLSQ